MYLLQLESVACVLEEIENWSKTLLNLEFSNLSYGGVSYLENKIKLILLIGMPSSTDLGGCQNSILKFDIVFTPLFMYS